MDIIESKTQCRKLHPRLVEIGSRLATTKSNDQSDSQTETDMKQLAELCLLVSSTDQLDASLADQVKMFFANRWQQIEADTSLRYDTAFYQPINQFCLKFSQIIAPLLNLSSYQLLIPSINQLTDLYGSDIDDFKLHEILITGPDNDNFLDVITCLTNSLSPHSDLHQLHHTNQYQPGANPHVELGECDLTRLSARDSWTKRLIASIQELQENKLKIGCLNELLALRDGLLQGDVQHEGEELNAASPANEAMVTFQQYLETISEKERDAIFSLEHHNPAFRIRRFSDLWEALCHPERDSGSGELTITSCIYLRGQDLAAIIEHNQAKLSTTRYQLSLQEANEAHHLFLESTQLISNLLPHFIEGNDEGIIEAVTQIKHCNQPNRRKMSETLIRLCILYAREDLVLTILNIFEAESINEWGTYILNDLALHSPETTIQALLPFIQADHIGDDGLSFIARVIISKRSEVLASLLELHPNIVSHKLPKKVGQSFTPCTLLKLAFQVNHATSIEVLLSKGADIFESFDTNALIYALQKKNTAIADKVSDHIVNQDVNCSDHQVNYYQVTNYISECLRQKNTTRLRALTRIIEPDYRVEVLKRVIHLSDPGILAKLLEDFPKLVNERLPDGNTALSYTINFTQNEPIITCLLCYGANPNQPSRTRSLFRKELTSYPIIAAAKLNLENIIDLLLSNGANPSVTDFNGQTYESINEAKTSDTRPRALC